MEEEKKDNKKAGMKRALNVRDILNKKYDVFPFEGKWKDAFDTPEVRGCWFVWGNSGNGKTSFVMQLCKELCKYDRVAFNSLEEGTSPVSYTHLKCWQEIENKWGTADIACPDGVEVPFNIEAYVNGAYIVLGPVSYTHLCGVFVD